MAFPSETELVDFLQPVVGEVDHVIESIVVKRAGRHSTIQVNIFADLTGLEQCAGKISAALDQAEATGKFDLGQQEYTLEVSSPGTDMPLTRPHHFQRNLGRLVQVTGADGRNRRLRLGAVNADGTQIIAVETDAKLAKTSPIRVEQVAELAGAVVQIEFSAVPKAQQQYVELGFAEAAQLAHTSEQTDAAKQEG